VTICQKSGGKKGRRKHGHSREKGKLSAPAASGVLRGCDTACGEPGVSDWAEGGSTASHQRGGIME